MKIKIPYWPLLAVPWLLLFLGVFSNALVISQNRGHMPVEVSSADQLDENPVHCVMTHQSHLKFLADWIYINGEGIMSPGDFFIYAYYLTCLPFLYVWITLMVFASNQ